MPYASKAQRGYFHAHPEKVGGKKMVAEFDAASKGKKLPNHVKDSKTYRGSEKHGNKK